MSSPQDEGDNTVPGPILMAATAEHFAMQGVVSTCVTEQQARASMFLVSVSGALVAIGIVAATDKFLLFTSAIIPVLYVIGLLTILRLVDVGMESLQSLVTIAKIHTYYRSLGKPAQRLFDAKLGRWPEGKTDPSRVIGATLGLLTTAASMIAFIVGFIGGSGLALLAYQAFGWTMPCSLLIGGMFVILQVVAVCVYQDWRIRSVSELAAVEGSDNQF